MSGLHTIDLSVWLFAKTSMYFTPERTWLIRTEITIINDSFPSIFFSRSFSPFYVVHKSWLHYMPSPYSQFISVPVCPHWNQLSCFYVHVMWCSDTLYGVAVVDIWVDAWQGQRFNEITSLKLFFLAAHSSCWRSSCTQTHVSCTLICSSFSIALSEMLSNHLVTIEALAFHLLLKIWFSFFLAALCWIFILCFGLQLQHKERFCTGQRCRCACTAAWRPP